MVTPISSIRRVGRLTALALTAAVLLGGCGGGDEAGLVVAPSVLDWGQVIHGERLVRELTLTNTSKQAIYVNEVKPNCKCVQPGPFQRNLHPGESRTVQVVLDTSTLPIGELKGKKLDILSNDPHQPFASADVVATVYRTHTIAPEGRLDVGRLAGMRRDLDWRVLLRPVGDAKIELVRAVVSPAGVFDITTEAVDDGHDVLLRVAKDAGGDGVIQCRLAVELEVEEPGRAKRRAVERIRVDGSW